MVEVNFRRIWGDDKILVVLEWILKDYSARAFNSFNDDMIVEKWIQKNQFLQYISMEKKKSILQKISS